MAVSYRPARVVADDLEDRRVSALDHVEWGACSPTRICARDRDVAAIFNRDLARRGEAVRFDLARFEDPRLAKALSAVYRQPVPLGARPSIYDYL
jgi:hypothetical protein